MRKIIKFLLIYFFLFINLYTTYAAAWLSDPLPKYYLFFQNNLTKEIKYTKHNDFIFDHYFDKYIKETERLFTFILIAL